MRYTSFKNKIAFVIAVLFHSVGAAGIIFSHHKNWFIQFAPLNLILMAILLMWTQLHRNKAFLYFMLIAYITGMVTEIIGVNTGYIFGSYHYQAVLGQPVFGVPLLTGVNWFILLYCTGMVMQRLHRWLERKASIKVAALPSFIQTASFIIDGALLATFFDWVIEPVAIKLQFWAWHTNSISPFNYICWFIISAVLLTVFRFLNFDKQNHFAVHLFFIQLLFFFLLRTFL